jgi:hypothetical protein
MLIYLSILILLFAPLVMLAVRLIRPAFGYHWLIAAGAALIAWPAVLLAGLSLPQTSVLFSWKPGALFPSWPILLVDRISWPFAVALVTLILAVILTDVARAPEADWVTWSESLVLTGLGLLAVLAGNPLTLLLTWSAIDLVELLILLGHVKESRVRERVVVSFSARVLGSGLLVTAVLVASAAGDVLTFAVISPQASLLLLLACGLRLGVLPLHLPFLQEPPLRRGLGTMIRLVPAAASLVLLARTAAAISGAGELAALAPALLALSGLAAVFAGAAWVLAVDELEGRPAWLLGLASLAFGATLRGQPAASLAWGMAALFSGGLLFLSSTRDRRLSWLTLLGLLGFSALPYSPSWNGARLYASPFHPLLVLFLLAQALLLFGYARHTLRRGRPLAGVERWVWLIYPVGLALLPVTHFVLGGWSNPSAQDLPRAGWWVGAAALALAGLGFFWSVRGPQLPRPPLNVIESFFSLNWFYGSLWAVYRFVGRLLEFITLIFEGEGGVLWALLLLVLLLSLLARNGGV